MAERRFSVLSYPLKFFSGNIILTDYTRINSFWQSLFFSDIEAAASMHPSPGKKRRIPKNAEQKNSATGFKSIMP